MIRRVSITLGIFFALSACAPSPSPPTTQPPDKLVFQPATFAALSGWDNAGVRSAYAAFGATCAKLVLRDDATPFGGSADYGIVADWKPACTAALNSPNLSDAAARGFFSRYFTPVRATNNGNETGLFTGYYEPELNGSRKRHGRFQTPLLARPQDLVTVDLGAFRDNLKGERIAGRVEGAKLVPYAERGEIVAGALGSRAKALAYVDDPVDAFFLQVQGSGRVKLADGSVIRVGYDGQNGFPYTAIGRVLVQRGAIPKDQLSMQSIRIWLDAHPGDARALMNENASYVFFKELPISDPNQGAPGSAGVPLTAEASLAVDTRFHGLGAPMWIEAHAPARDAAQPDVDFDRLLVAQDTGGAIRGPVRGDVYWGAGKVAESIAGRMAHKGTLYVLLPKAVAAKLKP
ncbi:MAG: murein transglycosylase [Alphaproteobacteria bacterium]|nr:murein transglycosylase [Alphaproteobacteria bacterium]